VFPDEDKRSAPAPRRTSRVGRRIVVFLASLLALAVVAAGGFVVFLNEKVSGNITQEELLPTPAAATPSATLPGGEVVKVPQKGVGQNYLIIGSDARPGEGASRSDVIVLAHVPQDKSAVQLVHFPRDLYVSIPGRGKDKINAAYAYGGAPLLVRTLQDLLGVKVDHVAKTDFEGFRSMTDAVGGVRVYAEEPSSTGGITIREGFNDLNGEQALAFVRERYQLSEGDISRGRRQQAFIKALMMKALSREVVTNPVRLAKFADAATDNLVVDKGLTVGKMRTEAFALRGVRSGDVVFVTAPFTGFGTAPDGGSIDIVDERAMSALGKALRTDTMDEYADVSVIP
jgi:LCP family protein required for cell wall assembly